DKSQEKDYFLQCLHSVSTGKPRRLPPNYDWLKTGSAKHLETAETLSQEISLYAWLPGKFPHIFHESSRLPALRDAVNRYIERALLTQAGYGNTSKELLYLK